MVAEGLHDTASGIAEALAERLSRQPQDLGRPELIALGELQDGRKEDAIHFELGLGIQVRAPGPEALADEISEGGPTFVRNGARRTFGAIFARR
jgi:hypothetical protein